MQLNTKNDVTPKNAQEFSAQQATIKYIKKLIGSADFINGNVRYCLWIPDNELETALLCPIIQKRVNALCGLWGKIKSRKRLDFMR